MTETRKTRTAYYLTLLLSLGAMAVLALSLIFSRSDPGMPDEGETVRRDPPFAREDAGSSSLEDEMERLRAIPYANYADSRAGDRESGVTLHFPDKAWPGYNLYCSRLVPEAYLLDMEGKEVHRWTFPNPRKEERIWDHVVMLPSGDLYVLRKFNELVLLDWKSNLKCRRKIEVHHDLIVAPDRTLWALVRDVREYREMYVEFDWLGHLTPKGRVLERWTTFDALPHLRQTMNTEHFLDAVIDRIKEKVYREAESPEAAERELTRMREEAGHFYDYFHLNSVQLLPDTELGRGDARFREGNLLLCCRNVNQIVVLDRETFKVQWAWGHDELQHPHHATLLENGRILLFDNGILRHYSRVLEVNPLTGRIDWEYKADPPEDFYSFQKGSAQRLPNGNTLICSGDEGRAFEITTEGEIVWEWLNPVVKQDRRATIYRMTRIDLQMVDRLLGAAGD